MSLKSFATELIARKDADLRLRAELIQRGELSEGYHPKMRAVHRANTKWLDRRIDEFGYPTADRVGEEASAAAWLIVQHAIDHPDFMRRCARLLRAAVAAGRTKPQPLAYLTDRIAVFEGRPQRYGTQFDWDANGQLSPQPYDDLDAVNRRRRELGWNDLSDQTRIMRERAAAEQEHPPVDWTARQEAMEAWRKQVGWTENGDAESLNFYTR